MKRKVFVARQVFGEALAFLEAHFEVLTRSRARAPSPAPGSMSSSASPR
jgi:hypothetical protein